MSVESNEARATTPGHSLNTVQPLARAERLDGTA